MRIHYLQHVPFEGPGIIKNWIESKNYQLTNTKFFENDILPEVEEIDWLIIMGGPMSVKDEEEYAWLKKEKTFIKKAIKSEKIVIGICLGAQLIADVLGSKIYRNDNKEIGWFPVKKVHNNGEHDVFNNLPEEFLAFHWHGETFDMPEGAVHLAFSEACKNQAFLYNNKVLGLQFHLEVAKESILALIQNCKDELVPGKFIQSAEQMVSYSDNEFIMLNDVMRKIFEKFV